MLLFPLKQNLGEKYHIEKQSVLIIKGMSDQEGV